MNVTSRYIDPATGSYVVGADGKYVRVPAGVGRAHNLVVMIAGSVPNGPQFKCRMRKVGSLYPGVAGDVEHMIDEALKNHVGTLFRGYTRKAWIEGGRLLHELSVDGESSGSIPVAQE